MTGSDVLISDQLAAFAVFARHANLTRAAAELHIAQPSLHAKIAKLSVALGVTLYERAGRDLVLTPEGHALAAFAGDHRRAIDDFLAMLGTARAPLRIAAGRAALLWVLAEPMRALAKAGDAMAATPADRAEALRLVDAGTVDVAAIAYDPPPDHLESQRLATVPQVVLVRRGHPLARRKSVRLSELAELGLVVPPRGRPHRETLERAFAEARTSLHVASEADGWDVIVHLASLGIGAAIVNGCVPSPRSLAVVPVSDLPYVHYWLCWRSSRQQAVAPLLQQVQAND